MDDDPAFGAFLKEPLEDAGYAVVCATDLVEALARLGSDSRGFDAVVADERMPGLAGTELVAGLRAGPRAWYTPVVLVSAFADAALERRAAALGVARVLPKPAPLVDILAALESVAPVW